MPELNYLDPTMKIESDEVYYRSDWDDINDLLSTKQSVYLIMGLRRFGKTSFLLRIKRLCSPDGKFPDWTSSIHYTELRFKKFLDNLQKTVRNFRIQQEEDNSQYRHIILIDDLQFLDSRFSDQDTDKEAFITNLQKVFTDVFQTAINSGGKLKILLAEPTNFNEWLDGEIGLVGKLLPDIAKIALRAATFPPIIKALDVVQAYKLLRAEQKDGTYHSPDFGQENAIQVCNETGGNPWLLAHAQLNVRIDPNLMTPPGVAEKVIESIKNTVRVQNNRELFDTIFRNLSKEEKFILRLLSDIDNSINDRRDNAAAVYFTRSRWRPEAIKYAQRMEDMGLIHTTPEKFPDKIRSIFISESMRQYFKNNLVRNSTDEHIKKTWESLLTTRFPDPKKHPTTSIIHQISDIFFSERAIPDAWNIYMEYLRNLNAVEKPHLIVICGNVLSSPSNNTSLHTHLSRMREALQELLDKGNRYKMLQPAVRESGFGMEEVVNHQIVVVPGIYDCIWSNDEMDREARQLFERSLGDMGIKLNQPLYFDIPNIVIVPFDTVSLEDIRRKDPNISTKLASLRVAHARAFRRCWDSMEQNTCSFTRDILFYSSEPEGWQDFGYVGQETVKGTLSNMANVVGDNIRYQPLKIAVTHHKPQHQQPKNELEFSGDLEFRKLLIRNGVQLLMHGHSPLQTCLTETIPKWPEELAQFHMVGAGSFCPNTAFCGHQGTNQPPTLNVIRINNQDEAGDYSNLYHVEIRFGSIERGRIELGVLPTQLTLEGRI